MKLSISYKVHEHGWAMVYFSDGEKTIDSRVSYLHDSLGELAEMAISIKAGHSESKVFFMDEPGELIFIVLLNNEEANYEVRWFNDWSNWGMNSEYKVLLKGTATPKRIVQQITTVLWDIHQNIGPDKYKELWCEHDFPIQQYKKLANA